ncbi:hypothetical protein CEXT_130121 [Caerostris extrusa]|uniref:Uncharacterized protein n=1 Tax=Caerostris extrusa TaxID=172846 RepID=A0AAV4PQ49_CAEEX|nr:hypothetical protein CEXT_130121 [Caerostris extrusa]
MIVQGFFVLFRLTHHYWLVAKKRSAPREQWHKWNRHDAWLLYAPNRKEQSSNASNTVRGGVRRSYNEGSKKEKKKKKRRHDSLKRALLKLSDLRKICAECVESVACSEDIYPSLLDTKAFNRWSCRHWSFLDITHLT